MLSFRHRACSPRLIIRCLVGYTVLALNQTVYKKLDPKTHVNVLDALLAQLRPRAGLVLLKRLTIVLDEESEKGFGLVRASPTSPPPLLLPIPPFTHRKR